MNDAEMIEYCALGIAMGNAKPGLKAIAAVSGLKNVLILLVGVYLQCYFSMEFT
ncbi:hypothetical protein GMA19_01003 [Paenibacillus polymyxa E681]|nr:hypothetical protein PPE_05325 [Paenibacillus polymyxa E681]QNV55851.1 hypothetical protein GE561_01004 [Paenibacillus polymyxa E681]QNV60687.1 hypothetical protein GMA19_01003 [Paenibacillus polymyxa E681]